MAERWIGLVASADKVVAVTAEVPENGPIVIEADNTWPLQSGDRPQAYSIMRQHVADYIREHGVQKAIVKASATSRSGMSLAHLESAELRGVVISAAASEVPTVAVSKAATSRTFGERKVDEYVADGEFWSEAVTGANLRAGSREAALLLLAQSELPDFSRPHGMPPLIFR